MADKLLNAINTLDTDCVESMNAKLAIKAAWFSGKDSEFYRYLLKELVPTQSERLLAIQEIVSVLGGKVTETEIRSLAL